MNVAVCGKCEDGLSEGNGLIVEGVSVEVGEVFSVLIESAWDLAFIGGSPEVVVADIA